MPHLPDDLYATIEQSIPIVCVDVIPVRYAADGSEEVGLILRDSPYGRVWCHLGGRVHYGETIRDALVRHVDGTVYGARIELDDDPQPSHVYQWFPPGVAPDNSNLMHGVDPRKHSIALTFPVSMSGSPVAVEGGEAFDFRFFAQDNLPADLWPGCSYLFERVRVR